MGTVEVVILGVLHEHRAEVSLVDDNHVIEAEGGAKHDPSSCRARIHEGSLRSGWLIAPLQHVSISLGEGA